jgi:hypothetical protein
VTTFGSNIPDRMLRRGRGPVERFDPDEPLYWRCVKAQLIDLPGSGLPVRFPDFSVNRGGLGFGPASDVLIPSWPTLGVIQFLVRDIPSQISFDHNTRYEFRAVHVPQDENYAHSEVRTFKNGNYDPKLEIKSKIVKKAFRQQLGERAVTVIVPQE